MAILPLNFEEGRVVALPMGNGGSSQAYAVGDMLKVTSGYYLPATVGQNTDVEAVCVEAGTVTTDGTLLKCYPTRGIKFVADTDANPARTDVGTYCDVATASTLDPDASTDDLFYIEDVYGQLADKKVVGYFALGVPNS